MTLTPRTKQALEFGFGYAAMGGIVQACIALLALPMAFDRLGAYLAFVGAMTFVPVVMFAMGFARGRRIGEDGR